MNFQFHQESIQNNNVTLKIHDILQLFDNIQFENTEGENIRIEILNLM